jgi:RNA polymerase sigma-70 factor (ECF subfamily)
MKNGTVSADEIKLIKALQEGDVFAFNEFFHRYSQKIYNFACKHLEREEDAQDLLQDVFITIWNRRKDIDEKQSFNGYLFAITLNAIRKYFRKKVKDRELVDRWLSESKNYSDVTKLTVEYHSLKERADKIIETMPPQRKTVFLMSREEGLRIDEIARRMNIAQKTAENHLHLALKYLREKLTEETFLLILFFILFY